MTDDHGEVRVPHLRGDETHIFAGAQKKRRVGVPALIERTMPQTSAMKQV